MRKVERQLCDGEITYGKMLELIQEEVFRNQNEEMTKRVKINFETVNEGNYEIIPPDKVAESNDRIKKEMKAARRKRARQIAESYKNVFQNAKLDIPNQMAHEWDEDLRAMKWALNRMFESIEHYRNRDGQEYHLLRIGFNELAERVSKYNCIKMKKDEYPCDYGKDCRCLMATSSSQSAVGKIKTDEPDELSTK